MSILLYTRNPYSCSHFEIVICIYSVMGDIDHMSTNTCSYTICSAPNGYIFVYILFETRIAPLMGQNVCSLDANNLLSMHVSQCEKHPVILNDILGGT